MSIAVPPPNPKTTSEKNEVLYVLRPREGTWLEVLRAPRIQVARDNNGTLFQGEGVFKSIFIPHASGTICKMVEK